MAENFTKTYKQAFSGFKGHNIFPEADRDTFHLRSDKAEYKQFDIFNIKK